MSKSPAAFKEALEQIENVIKFKKCWKCGCNQGAIKGLEKELGKLSAEDRAQIDPLIEKSKSTFQPIEYDCLGCKTCFPGDLGNALAKAYPELELEPDSCASDNIFVEERTGYLSRTARFRKSTTKCMPKRPKERYDSAGNKINSGIKAPRRISSQRPI